MNSLLTKDNQSVYSQLHNNYALRFGKHIARIMEYEIYPWDDPFTHRNERQRLYDDQTKRNLANPNIGSLCAFYVHRSKQGRNDPYKQGSYKGIDIVIHGGILIRSILVVSSYGDDIKHLCKSNSKYGGTLIEGPCCVVDHMCALTGWSLQELEDKLQLIKCNWNIKAEYNDTSYPIYLGSRVGLTMKRAPIGTPCKDAQGHDITSWAKHIILPYRSCTFIPSKEKETLFVTSINRKDVPSRTARYQEEYKQGSLMQSLNTTMTQLQVAGYLSK